MELYDLDCLFAVYVTTKAPVKVLDDLVKSSADHWPSADEVKSTKLLCVFRNKTEYPERLSTTSSTPTYTYDLVKFTLETFPDDSFINNNYFIVVDERSIQDRTCVLVEIPEQAELDPNDKTKILKRERNFQRHDGYAPDPNGWVDDEGKRTGVDELKAVRVRFEDANMANMLDDDHETIGFLARQTYPDGVYKD